MTSRSVPFRGHPAWDDNRWVDGRLRGQHAVTTTAESPTAFAVTRCDDNRWVCGRFSGQPATVKAR